MFEWLIEGLIGVWVVEWEEGEIDVRNEVEEDGREVPEEEVYGEEGAQGVGVTTDRGQFKWSLTAAAVACGALVRWWVWLCFLF